MADDLVTQSATLATIPTASTIATDQGVGGEHYQQIKLVDGTADSTTVIVAGGGVEASALRVTVASDSTGVLSVDDNGGSLTVDGTFFQATQPVSDDGGSLTVDDGGGSITVDGTVALSAGATNVGSTGAYLSDSAAPATVLTPKFATIVASASGATVIVAANATKKIRVLSYDLVANGAVNVKWQSASTDKTGLLYFAANGGISTSFSPVGHFETAANEALNINLSAAIAVGGQLVYVEV